MIPDDVKKVVALAVHAIVQAVDDDDARLALAMLMDAADRLRSRIAKDHARYGDMSADDIAHPDRAGNGYEARKYVAEQERYRGLYPW